MILFTFTFAVLLSMASPYSVLIFDANGEIGSVGAVEGPTVDAMSQCPSEIPFGFKCVCHLVAIPPPTTPRPTCPPYDPDNYDCICTEECCKLILKPTTHAPSGPPTCPSYDPYVYDCCCNTTSCHLVEKNTSTPSSITTTESTTSTPKTPSTTQSTTSSTPISTSSSMTTTTEKPKCPPSIPEGCICKCNATSCEVVTTKPTKPPKPTSTSSSTQSMTITSTSSTAPSTTTALTFECDCGSKPNGNYDLTRPCTGKFCTCSNGFASIFDCPAGLVFNPSVNQCDFRFNVPICASG